jgi:hypothetical protein
MRRAWANDNDSGVTVRRLTGPTDKKGAAEAGGLR